MEWVETTGKTVDEAMDRALAHLGIHRDDAEVEVLEEPKSGLFGRVRGEARVRARVRPSGPRPKRSRRSGERNDRPKKAVNRHDQTRSERELPNQNRRVKEKSSVRQPSNTKVQDSVKTQVKEEKMAEGISLAEQGAIAKEFLVGLLSSMEILAEVSVKEIDAETVEISINATPPTELGVLVGPRGSTLQALQEVTRTVVQSKSPSRTDRILVDVAQYRERRVAALGRFANQVATEVLETGEERALEPMSAADRKAVHDALSGNSAVVTRSEGEDPRRFVVVAPA
jgi:spoIIIJ-associated protein